MAQICERVWYLQETKAKDFMQLEHCVQQYSEGNGKRDRGQMGQQNFGSC